MEKSTKISYYAYQKFPSSREVSIFLNDKLIEKEDIISIIPDGSGVSLIYLVNTTLA